MEWPNCASRLPPPSIDHPPKESLDPWIALWGHHCLRRSFSGTSIPLVNCLIEPSLNWLVALQGHHCICRLLSWATTASLDHSPGPPLHLLIALKDCCPWFLSRITFQDCSWRLLSRISLQDHTPGLPLGSPSRFAFQDVCSGWPS